MNRYFAAALAACSLLALSGTASAQAPVVTLDAPANGVDLSTVTDNPDLFSKSKVTVTGSATHPTRVSRVQYRIEGRRKWRNATLIRVSETEGTVSYAWSFRMSMGKRSARRVYVRAFDDAKNESDITGRRVLRGPR